VDATLHMVNDSFLDRMKEGAVLINTSRGKVVDETVLRARAGKLGALVLDVWQREPTISTDTMKLVDIATPHIAGYSFDGKVNGVEMLHEAACAFFFHERTWHSGRHLDNKLQTIDVSRSKNPLYAAVMKAYPIMEDDRKLRELAKLPPEKQGAWFDRLRKEYPQRREFRHFKVSCAEKCGKERETLQRLGFCV
jgi:erythronate-4-phosphate dehydrogenase